MDDEVRVRIQRGGIYLIAIQGRDGAIQTGRVRWDGEYTGVFAYRIPIFTALDPGLPVGTGTIVGIAPAAPDEPLLVARTNQGA
jgi:hypothetical protein